MTDVTMATNAQSVPVAALVADDDGMVVVDMQGVAEGSEEALGRVGAVLAADGGAPPRAEVFAAYVRAYGLRPGESFTVEMGRDEAAAVATQRIAAGRSFGTPERVSMLDRVAAARERLMMNSTAVMDATVPPEEGVDGAWLPEPEREFMMLAGARREDARSPERQDEDEAFLAEWRASRGGDAPAESEEASSPAEPVAAETDAEEQA